MGAATALGVAVSGSAAAAAVVLTSAALAAGHVSAALIAVPALLCVAVLELVGGRVARGGGVARRRGGAGAHRVARAPAAPVAEPEAARDDPEPSAPISMRAVGLAYDGHEVVADVSLDLGAGDVVVAPGRAEVGKTTSRASSRASSTRRRGA